MNTSTTYRDADSMAQFTACMDALADTIADAINAFDTSIISAHSMSNAQVTVGSHLAQLQMMIATERRRAHQLAAAAWGD